jgi:tetratricopeptide (TPR) repeat protein
VLRFQMERALGDGRFEEIRPLTHEAVRVRGRAEVTPGYLASFLIWSTYERTLRGKRAWFDRNIARLASGGPLTPLMRGHLAFVYAAFGELDQARAVYQPLLAPGALDATRADNKPFLFVLLADAVCACGDRDAAAELYPRLAPYAALNAAHFEWWVYLGSCAHWLGLLAASLGEPKLAAMHFETALELNASLGARPALARTSLAYARTLLRSGGGLPRSVAAHARSLLRDATALAEQLEMRALLRDAQQLVD